MPEAPRNRLRVMTINLLAPDKGDWPRRRPLLRDGIARLRPDVIALQEIAWGQGHDQAADLLGPGYHLVRHSARSADGVGAILASRWPAEKVREVDLHVTPRVTLPWSAAVLAAIDAPPPFGRVLLVHHKPTYEVGYAYERELQAVSCAKAIEAEVAGEPMHVVLVGDFDDTPDSASVRFWTGRQSLRDTSVAYRDAWEAVHPEEAGHTFTPENPLEAAGEMSLEPGRRIDYVMVRCGPYGPSLEVVACSQVFDRPVEGVWASDHIGVVADLRVPDRPPGASAL